MRALLKNNKQNNNGFTHIDSDGSAHMVDVGDKKTTNRVAVASSEIIMEKETLDLIQNGGFEKGDVLGVAKVAGIMAAKKCSELIPLCHPLNINQIDIFFEENPSVAKQIVEKALLASKARHTKTKLLSTKSRKNTVNL